MADREALDLFTGDMAGHQEKTGKMPTPGENQALAAAVFERLDRKAEERKPAVAVDPPETKHIGPPETKHIGPPETKHIGDLSALNIPALGQPVSPVDRKAKEMGYRLLRGAAAPETVPVAMGGRVLERYTLIRRRVKLLMSKQESGPLGQPSWRDQVLAVESLQFTGRSEPEVAAVAKVFGPKVAAVHAAQGGKASAAIAILKVLDESSAVFGPWWAQAPKRIQVG